ncbi:MAG: tetratricopeptide repeat protein [Acidobacteriota bacterium]|nr:MAG: tetratricopeptide repeat protein [Acidobacteriota bacterium]
MRPLKIPAALLLFAVLVAASSPSFVYGQEDEEEFTQTAPADLTQDDTEKAIKAFNAGQDAHEAGDLDRALEHYKEAIGLMPEFPEAEYQIGSIYESRGDLDRAEQAYRLAIEYKPDWTLPMAALGGLLVTKGSYQEAGAVLRKTIDLDGMCIPCYPAMTEVLLKTGAGPDVLKTHLQKLTILTSKAKIPASIWAAKAAVERKTGDLPAAEESIRRALLLDENSVPALAQLVEIRIESGDAESASAIARRLTESDPASTAARIQLAKAEHLAGRSQNAVSILEPIASSEESAKELLATIKLDSESDPGPLEKLLADRPDDPGLLGRLCEMTRRTAPEKALDYCLRASKAEPANINHAIGYAGALLQLNRNPEAAALLTRLKQSFPDNFTVRTNLAFALFRLERFEDARAEYEWITSKQPELAAGFYFLAICYDRLGRYPDAMANYQKFLRLADPEDFTDEISRVELRLPILQKQIKEGKGKN